MEKSIDVSEATFQEEVIARSVEIPVVVDFWAPWCGPCRMLSPLLEKLVKDPDFNFILAKVNVDENPNLSMQYRVQGIPAVKGFLHGDVVSEFVGAQPEPQIRAFLAKLIPDEVEEALYDAKSLLAIQQWVEAEGAFRQLHDEYPKRADVNLGLARVLLAQGEGCEAKTLLGSIRDGKEMAAVEQLQPLAQFLCRMESSIEGVEQMSAIEAQYVQAGRLLMRGNFEAALDGFLEVLRQDKRYRKGEVKDVVLGIFALLGDESTLTLQYRNELASVLF